MMISWKVKRTTEKLFGFAAMKLSQGWMYIRNVGGSIPSPRTNLRYKWKPLIWGQYLGLPNDPYMRRWVFDFYLFSVRIHHWFHSDDLEYQHNHAWGFITLTLFGQYNDISNIGTISHTPGTIRFRPANHFHSVWVVKPCWTLLLTGPYRQDWGFKVGKRFVKARRFFFEFGHHAKENNGPRVKTKP